MLPIDCLSEVSKHVWSLLEFENTRLVRNANGVSALFFFFGDIGSTIVHPDILVVSPWQCSL